LAILAASTKKKKKLMRAQKGPYWLKEEASGQRLKHGLWRENWVQFLVLPLITV
jgi:hypothetical protein